MSLRWKMIYTHSSTLTALIAVLLVINLLNLVSVWRLENKFEADEVIDIYNPKALMDLKGKSLSNSETRIRELYSASRSSSNKNFYKTVKLEAFCAIKERVGDIDDGGKYVCHPRMVKKTNCTLISLGLNNQVTFDQHIWDVTGRHCKMLAADKDPQHSETQGYYEKMNGEIFVGMIPNELTISSMMEKSGRRDVDILKMDIEKGEFGALEPFIKEYSVCQILIEIHGTPSEHLKMLKIMARYNFRIFNVDPNPYCIECSEYSLIHDSCMDQYGVVPLTPIIPRSEY
ncbi:hypothetical protein L3Y34_002965 [Caenorhabditis briggsae]|uniref:Methyltransferase FkbM domain-containing protein n=3 Tax=Caenorhabditis briggsae TaxID=6238 RepID=A0AAE9A675_CAEBR|nr:hypothetical protein L3Y34_002965 [Caenorhabditis briggsae]